MIAADRTNKPNTETLDASADARADDVVAAFEMLVSGLPVETQELVRSKIQKSSLTNSRPREMLATVLRLVPRDRAVSVDEVKKGVEAEGISVSAKAVADTLGYLFRTNKISRISHGRYSVGGAVLDTLDPLIAGPPTRDMIDDY